MCFDDQNTLTLSNMMQKGPPKEDKKTTPLLEYSPSNLAKITKIQAVVRGNETRKLI
jgi:hypothetical protein